MASGAAMFVALTGPKSLRPRSHRSLKVDENVPPRSRGAPPQDRGLRPPQGGGLVLDAVVEDGNPADSARLTLRAQSVRDAQRGEAVPEADDFTL